MLTRNQIRVLTFVPLLGLVVGAPIELLQVFLEIVHHFYELLEFVLDEIIHHLFHTRTHTTQVIVFYLMMGIFSYGLYRLALWLKAVYAQAGQAFRHWLADRKPAPARLIKALPFARRPSVLFGLSFGLVILAITVF